MKKGSKGTDKQAHRQAHTAIPQKDEGGARDKLRKMAHRVQRREGQAFPGVEGGHFRGLTLPRRWAKRTPSPNARKTPGPFVNPVTAQIFQKLFS